MPSTRPPPNPPGQAISSPPPGPVFFSFYSIKGGVGRTMALANAAFVLAVRHGLNVLAVDWDLEAPGLHYYFGFKDEDLTDLPGLLDLLVDLRAQIPHGADAILPKLSQYTVSVKSDLLKRTGAGKIWLMHCGRRNESYIRRVTAFNWKGFYEDHAGFFCVELVKRLMREAADMVLIDSRTGFAELGQVSVLQVADVVCLCFTCNRQNLVESMAMCRTLKDKSKERKARGLGPLSVFLVPSRIPTAERGLYQAWLEEAKKEFNRLVTDGVIGRPEHPLGLETSLLPFDAHYAFFEERLPAYAFLQREGRVRELPEAMGDLGLALFNLSRGLPVWQGRIEAARPEIGVLMRRPLPAEAKKSLEKWEEEKARAIDRRDSAAVAFFQFQIGNLLIEYGQFSEAVANLEASLSYNRTVGNRPSESAILHAMGHLRAEEGKKEEAWRLFEQALDLDRQAGDLRGQGITLHEMGRLRAGEGKREEAWRLFEQALDLDRRAGVLREQGVTLHEMGRLRAEEGKKEEAWKLFEQALELERQAGDLRGQGVTLHAMGKLRLIQGRSAESVILFEEGLEAARRAEDNEGVIVHEEALSEARARMAKDKVPKRTK